MNSNQYFKHEDYVMDKKPEQSTAAELNTAAEPNKAPEQAPEVKKIDAELSQWQTKVDEAKLQLHLGAKEVQDKLQPHVDELEQELSQAQAQWQQFQDSAEGAWDSIEDGVNLSIKAMQKAFDKAKKHFPDEESK
jgi:predicted  nucleic acid-binding Zn-ribbon protein